jgi:hypothetical protein
LEIHYSKAIQQELFGLENISMTYESNATESKFQNIPNGSWSNNFEYCVHVKQTSNAEATRKSNCPTNRISVSRRR